jgi:CSLREA domain-containing protein
MKPTIFKWFFVTMVWLFFAGRVMAATYTVTKTADTNDGTCDADCSLREALAVANGNAGADTIDFNIQNTDPNYDSNADTWTITLGSGLTISVNESITIDGSTQVGNGNFPTYGGKVIVRSGGFSTITGGNGAAFTMKRMTFVTSDITSTVLLGVGNLATHDIQDCYFTRDSVATNGIYAITTGTANGNTIFTHNEIENFGRNLTGANSNAAASMTITNNYLPNAASIGINVTGYNTTITGNVFETAFDQGIISSCTGGTCTVSNNTFTANAGSFGWAVITANGAGAYLVSNNTITAGNSQFVRVTSPATIQDNAFQGWGDTGPGGKIEVVTNDAAKLVTIQNNSIITTNATPIRVIGAASHAHITNNVLTSTWNYVPLQISGGTEDANLVTANDVGDTDTGPNNLMNYPEIWGVEYVGGGYYKVSGVLDFNATEAPFTIEICLSDGSLSGHGGCSQYLGSTTTSDYHWETTVYVGDEGNVSHVFTTTATNSTGDTSEFSANFHYPVINNSSNVETTPSAPTCQDEVPTHEPDLFQVTSGAENAVVYFAPVKPASYYHISFGLGNNAEGYGVDYQAPYDNGVIFYQINNLDPKTTYHFKVRAGNGCATGNWSRVLSVKTDAKKSRGGFIYYAYSKIIKKISGFKDLIRRI